MNIRDVVNVATKNVALRERLLELYALKGVNTAEAKAKRRDLRRVIRNQGMLSLPFSMNAKR